MAQDKLRIYICTRGKNPTRNKAKGGCTGCPYLLVRSKENARARALRKVQRTNRRNGRPS